MKNILKMFLVVTVVVMIFLFNITMAANKEVGSVIVTDIDSPYVTNNVLDTKAEVPKDAFYRITDVAWTLPTASSSGLYEVTVTLKPSIGYEFAKTVTGTINGKIVSTVYLGEDDELEITYVFPRESSSSVGSSNVTLRYRIDTYCDKDKGTISPYIIRALHDSDQTITITPKEGYKIKDVKVDGESVGAVSEYTFVNVNKSHTIKAYFEEIEEEEIVESVKEKPIYDFLKVLVELIKM